MKTLKILQDFKKHINVSGVVSQQDIISLESLLCTNVITSQINLNQFSKVRTPVNLDKLDVILDENINKQKSLINSVTYLELLNQGELAKSISDNIVNTLKTIQDKLSIEVVSFLKDENNLKRYNTNGELYSIKDSSIYYILYTDLLFTEKIAEITNPTRKTLIFDKIIKHVEIYASKNKIETDLETMLQNVSDSLINFYNNKLYENLLSPENKNINIIHNITTISEVTKFIDNIQTYIDVTSNISNLFVYDEEQLLLMEQEDIMMYYNKAKQYTELMNDVVEANINILGLLLVLQTI